MCTNLIPQQGRSYTYNLSTNVKSRLGSKLLPLLNPHAPTLDDMADIPHGDLEWEVDGGEHLRKEYPPSGHAGHEPERSCSL